MRLEYSSSGSFRNVESGFDIPRGSTPPPSHIKRKRTIETRCPQAAGRRLGRAHRASETLMGGVLGLGGEPFADPVVRKALGPALVNGLIEWRLGINRSGWSVHANHRDGFRGMTA